jgi:hypothetical protein
LDLIEIAQQITSDTPAGAAESTARLINAALDALPHVKSRERFLAAFQQEMLSFGFNVNPVTHWLPFSNLEDGDRFRNQGGKLFRKLDVKMNGTANGNGHVIYNAHDITEGRPVYFSASERVEKIELEI